MADNGFPDGFRWGTATAAHLRRSEPARSWTLSLLDSLDGMYAPGAEPEAPDAGATFYFTLASAD